MRSEIAMSARRILVFGSTGTGKTSLLNCLTGQEHRVSGGARGCTFKTEEYQPIEKNGNSWTFFDTAGYDEPATGGTISHTDALKSLIDMLHKSTKGFNLIIMVIRMGRITETIRRNYMLFVDAITKHKVPVVCVVTGCENFDPIQQWVTENEMEFEKSSMVFNRMVGGCCASGGRMEPIFAQLRAETTEAVWGAITVLAAPNPVVFVEEHGGIWATVKCVLALLYRWADLGPSPSLQFLNGRLVSILIELGYSEADAIKIACKYV